MKRAVFLDRDGTLNADTGYISSVEDFVLFEETPLALKQLSDAGFSLIVVTNQSGVSRGFFTLEELHRVHQVMEQQLASCGVQLDAIYGCPHHPEEGCGCRKPATGLFEKAAKEHDVDLKESFMIGDKLIDIQAGLEAGCQTIWIDRKDLDFADRLEAEKSSHYTATSLLDAVAWILAKR